MRASAGPWILRRALYLSSPSPLSFVLRHVERSKVFSARVSLSGPCVLDPKRYALDT